MRVAVISATRDRLPYSVHCFATLREYAGCDYDHLVFDNGSTDGTADWLRITYKPHTLILSSQNIGINRAMNRLVEKALNDDDPYDLIVRFDNDAEVIQPDTLRTVCELALEHEAILAPRVLGLRNPPPTLNTRPLGDYFSIDETTHLGGIFMCIPASLFGAHGFRYDEAQPLWAGDELICPWWRARGGLVGYVEGWAVNHYLTTDGQHADQPEYFARTRAEGKAF